MSFWKPGTEAPPDALLQEDRDSFREENCVIYNPNANLSLTQQRVCLPIYNNRTHILYLVENHPTVIIVGQTGCGKTTQIPQYLHEAGWTTGGRVVACTQPRRVAAISVAKRVAEEMGVELGTEVGYAIRFDDKTDVEKTRIKYLTDGMLLREMMLDPLLTRYSVIMLDEAHERSLHTELLLGLLKNVQKQREELRLIVSSATVDAEDFQKFFGPKSAIMSIAGRMFPVDIHYLREPTADYLITCVDVVCNIHKTQDIGDVLVFLTGQEEIETVVSLLKERAHIMGRNRLRMLPLPMYAGLAPELQMRVFQPTKRGCRKIVIATNIAETSITIDGIVYVVDSCFVKVRMYSPNTNLEKLVVIPVSKAQANQRAGRAGRLRPGKCYRLCTERTFQNLVSQNQPEIQRCNVAGAILQLKALGVEDVVKFDFMAKPPEASMERALELLYALHALNSTYKLTNPLGMQMAEFPVTPQVARMLLASEEFGCSEEIVTIAAMLSIESVFLAGSYQGAADRARRKFAVAEGDTLTLMNVYNVFLRMKQSKQWCKDNCLNYRAMLRAVQVRNQLTKYLARFKVKLVSSGKKVEPICKCIAAGFFANAAQLKNGAEGAYHTVREDHVIYLHPSSAVYTAPPEWVVFNETFATTREYMRDVTLIEPNWLTELAPHYYRFRKRKREELF